MHANILQQEPAQFLQSEIADYIDIEYAAKGTILDFVRNEHVVVDVAFLTWTIRQLTDALAQLDSMHVVHGDITVRNLLVMSDDQLKLADFGNAFELGVSKPNSCTTTLDYAAPEMLALSCPREPKVEMTAKVDSYSIGVVLFTLVGGHHPYHPKPAAAQMGGADACPAMLAHLRSTPHPLLVKGSAMKLPVLMLDLLQKLTEMMPERRFGLSQLQTYVAGTRATRCQIRRRPLSEAEQLKRVNEQLQERNRELEIAYERLGKVVEQEVEMAKAYVRIAELEETLHNRPSPIALGDVDLSELSRLADTIFPPLPTQDEPATMYEDLTPDVCEIYNLNSNLS